MSQKAGPSQSASKSGTTKPATVLVGGKSNLRGWKAIARHFTRYSRSIWLVLCVVSLVGIWGLIAYYTLAQIAVQTPRQLARPAIAQAILSLNLAQTPPLPTSQPLVLPSPPSNAWNPEAIEGAVGEPGTTDERAIVVGSSMHLSYTEATPDQLMVIGSYSQSQEQRFERLHHEAGLAFLRMIDAARQEGVWIVPISGFRDFARQDMLFDRQTEQDGSREIAAKAVAPPGYSEHHTGYAIDLGDGTAQGRDISGAFEETKAFAWLTRHAQKFGFELSFPPNNDQGVKYEPWHWRYVSSPNAEHIFAPARHARFNL